MKIALWAHKQWIQNKLFPLGPTGCSLGTSTPRAPLQCEVAPAPPFRRPTMRRGTVACEGCRATGRSALVANCKVRRWAGLGTHPEKPSIFIYSKQGEPSPAQKNFLRTRRTLTWYVRWALI